MLCTMCQHGVTTKIGDRDTGAVWTCDCGRTNCRHIDRCFCGDHRRKYTLPPEGVVAKKSDG